MGLEESLYSPAGEPAASHPQALPKVDGGSAALITAFLQSNTFSVEKRRLCQSVFRIPKVAETNANQAETLFEPNIHSLS